MNSHRGPKLLFGLALFMASNLTATISYADNRPAFDRERMIVRQNSLREVQRQSPDLPVTPIYDREYQEIIGLKNRYLNQAFEASVPFVGQPAFDGAFGAARADVGTTGLITFSFLAPSTLLPITDQDIVSLPAMLPTIDSVMYEVNIDPFSDSYLPLGTATDPKTNFAFSFTVTGFEPDIRATPFNLGVPVFVRGVDGFNAAVGDVVILPASEPSTILLLLGAGLAYIMATLKRRTKSTYA